jgi:hypothetical protein
VLAVTGAIVSVLLAWSLYPQTVQMPPAIGDSHMGQPAAWLGAAGETGDAAPPAAGIFIGWPQALHLAVFPAHSSGRRYFF